MNAPFFSFSFAFRVLLPSAHVPGMMEGHCHRNACACVCRWAAGRGSVVWYNELKEGRYIVCYSRGSGSALQAVQGVVAAGDQAGGSGGKRQAGCSGEPGSFLTGTCLHSHAHAHGRL